MHQLQELPQQQQVAWGGQGGLRGGGLQCAVVGSWALVGWRCGGRAAFQASEGVSGYLRAESPTFRTG